MTPNPRRAAFDVLYRIDKERSYADILINAELGKEQLTGPDRGLFTELVYGILRRQGTLDHIISHCSSRSVTKLERGVLLLLRIGLYQLFFLDRIPASAAVNESVAMAHAIVPRAAGFINAVLRQADRQRDAIPFPDRDRDPAAHIAARCSHPLWLAEAWYAQLGLDEAELLAHVMSSPPPLTLRVNSLKISRDDLVARLAEEGVTAVAGRFAPDAVQVKGSMNPATLSAFEKGLCTVQDESSQLAALFLGARPGERVLDLCAAPGGKTTCLAQLMENRGILIATDVAARKLGLITDTASRLGIDIIETMHLNGSSAPLPFTDGEFDRVLVDAPCSGLGVLRRNPEGKWWKTPDNIAELAVVQKNLINNAAAVLKPGGTLLYATCSTTVAENEAVIDDFLSHHPGFVLEDLREHFPAFAELFTDSGCFRSWPHRHGMDGFFAARMKRMDHVN